MQLHIYKDSEALSQEVAKWIADRIHDTLKKAASFHDRSFPGGSTPKRVHQLLAAAPYKDQIDWTRLHVFWGDERASPFRR